MTVLEESPSHACGTPLCWGPRVHRNRIPGHLQQEAGCRAGSDNEMQSHLIEKANKRRYCLSLTSGCLGRALEGGRLGGPHPIANCLSPSLEGVGVLMVAVPPALPCLCYLRDCISISSLRYKLTSYLSQLAWPR